MARREAELGVESTYYFRIFPCSFVPDIVARIRDLGHEIGYHYEEWTTTKGDPHGAAELFAANLERIRRIAPVRSISMHGSPLGAESNLRIWEFCDFTEHGVIDATESPVFDGFSFFTDTGRTFGASNANLRDHLRVGDIVEQVKTSEDLCRFLASGARHRIYLSTHPERWNDNLFPWLTQWQRDISANAVKRTLHALRKLKRAHRS